MKNPETFLFHPGNQRQCLSNRANSSQNMLCVAFGTPNIASSQFDEYSQLGLRRKVRVKSKETVGNSWPLLEVILGHKYHSHYSRNPQQKVFFVLFHVFLSDCFDWVGVTDCKWQTKPTPSAARLAASLNKPRKMTVRKKLHNVVSTIVLPKSAPRKCSHCYWETCCY